MCGHRPTPTTNQLLLRRTFAIDIGEFVRGGAMCGIGHPNADDGPASPTPTFATDMANSNKAM